MEVVTFYKVWKKKSTETWATVYISYFNVNLYEYYETHLNFYSVTECRI